MNPSVNFQKALQTESSRKAASQPPNTLSSIPAVMQQQVDWGELAGAVTLVAREGEILEFDAVGYADLADRRPMKKDTLFWVASMTKPITAAAVLLLMEEGALGLTDPVEKYLPEFRSPWMIASKGDETTTLKRPSRPVTIRDLLTHTHGLDEPALPVLDSTLAGNVAYAARGPLQFEPGSEWRYGNAGMNTLGRIVEVISGQTFQDFLRLRFFEPLGMRRTTFYPDAEELKTLAKSYSRPPDWGPLVEVPIHLLNADITKQKQAVFPGGGLFSTTEEMFRFYQMLANEGEFGDRRYLAPSTVREMVTPQTGDFETGFSSGMAWGLGVGIVRTPVGWTEMLPLGTWGHDGAFGTTVMIEPQSRLLFIMMIQRAGLNPFRDGLRFRHAFHSAVMRWYRSGC